MKRASGVGEESADLAALVTRVTRLVLLDRNRARSGIHFTPVGAIHDEDLEGLAQVLTFREDDGYRIPMVPLLGIKLYRGDRRVGTMWALCSGTLSVDIGSTGGTRSLRHPIKFAQWLEAKGRPELLQYWSPGRAKIAGARRAATPA